MQEGDAGFIQNLDSHIHQMQTLPNIDINIKCGNSLVSYIPINESLLLQSTSKIKEYQALEKAYINGDFENRDKHLAKIKEIKQDLKNQHFREKFKDELTGLNVACQNYAKNFGEFGKNDLSEHYKFLKDSIVFNSLLSTINELDEQKAQVELDKLKKAHDKIFSLQGNFEWRIEFSKLLDTGLSSEQIAQNNANKAKGEFKNLSKDKQGDFIGFDIIIGNPPYIRQEEIKHLKPQLQKAFSIFTSTADIYTYFYEQGFKLLKNGGIVSLITSNKFCRAGYGKNLRGLLLQNTMLDFIELNGIKVFDKATVDTCIMSFLKAKANKGHTFSYANVAKQKPFISATTNNPYLANGDSISQPPPSLAKGDSLLNPPYLASGANQEPPSLAEGGLGGGYETTDKLSYESINSNQKLNISDVEAMYKPTKDLSNLTYTQMPQDSLTSEAFIFADSHIHKLKNKIEKIGTPLKEWDISINYGIKTGYNDAFIIDTATKDEILNACDDSLKSAKKSPSPCGFGGG